MYKQHNIVYPEYLEADTRDEIVKAVRQNPLFGARIIKICLDCKAWGYSVDDIELFISEAAKSGAKVDAHVQTRDGAQRAIDAGLHSISHGQQITPEQHAQMAKKGIYLASTDTPFTPYRGSADGEKRAAAMPSTFNMLPAPPDARTTRVSAYVPPMPPAAPAASPSRPAGPAAPFPRGSPGFQS